MGRHQHVTVSGKRSLTMVKCSLKGNAVNEQLGIRGSLLGSEGPGRRAGSWPSAAHGQEPRRWQAAGRPGPGWGLGRRRGAGPPCLPLLFHARPWAGRMRARGCRASCLPRGRDQTVRLERRVEPRLHEGGSLHTPCRTHTARACACTLARSHAQTHARVRGSPPAHPLRGAECRAEPRPAGGSVGRFCPQAAESGPRVREQGGERGTRFLCKCRILGFHREPGSGQKNDSLR